MADQNQKIDQNYKGSMTGVTNDANEYIRTVKVNPLTDRVLVEIPALSYTLDSIGVAGYRKSDGTYQPLRLDAPTNTLQTIEYEHHEIHGGSSFTTQHIADVASGGTISLSITTPNTTKWAHIIYELDTEGEAMVYLMESPTISGGTAKIIFNRDRNSSATTVMVVKYDPTIVSTGTIYRQWHLGSGRTTGQNRRGVSEFILKQNTTYVYALNNLSVSDNYISLKLDWYEHTNISL
jgi:hypothetical protein